MRELVECLNDWLTNNRADGGAYLLLVALTSETQKKLTSSDAAQREFDAQQLAAAAQRKEADDFDASKRWLDRAKLELFARARESAIEEHFRTAGHTHALRPRRRSPGGKHRAVWFLEPYALPDPAEDTRPTAGQDQEGSAEKPQTIQYDFTAPGQVKAAWYARPFLGGGSFVTRSWRGLLWVAVLLMPLTYLLLSVVAALGYTYARRPLQTSDLSSFVLLAVLGWVVWRLFVRPTVWLIADRIVPATELFVAWNEENAQLELATAEGKRRRLQLVRYSAVCPICAGTVELRYSQEGNRRRLLGCCSEAPHDHVFSFDRVLRRGQRQVGG